MRRRQAAELARIMMDWVRQGGLLARGVLGRGAARRADVAAQGRQEAARTRFWTELRSGQREAQARSAGPDR